MSGLSDAQVRAGWLPWNGAEWPWEDATYVEVMYRDGGRGHGKANSWRHAWVHEADKPVPSDIIAVRICEP